VDKVFFTHQKTTDDDAVVLVDDRGFPTGVNINLHGAAYAQEGRGNAGISRQAISDVLEVLASAFDQLKLARKVKINTPALGDKASSSKGVSSDGVRILTRPDPSLATEGSGSDLIGMLFRIDVRLGGEPAALMLDSGATITVIDKSWAEKVRERFPHAIVFRQINREVVLSLAIGQSQSHNEVAVVQVEIGGVPVHFTGLLVTNLSEQVLLGGNFLLSNKARLCYESLSLSLAPPGWDRFVVPVAKGTRRIRIVFLDASLSDIPEFSVPEVLPDHSERTSEVMKVKVADEREELCRVLWGKLVDSIQEGVISLEEAHAAMEQLSPYIMVFRSKLGCYRGGPIRLGLRVTEHWRPKKYGFPHVYAQAVRDSIASMVSRGILEPGITPYIHPIVIVPKKDGSIRICLDASALNQLLLEEHNDPPRLEDMLFEESAGGILSAIDFREGYLQLELDPESSHFLGIQIDGMTYVYRRLPFGTKVSGAIFNRIIRQGVLQGAGSKHLKVFVDDVKIQTPTFEHHLALLVESLKNIYESGMTLSLEKLEIFRRRIKYLGHIVSEGTLSKNFDKGVFFRKFEEKYFKDGAFSLPHKKSVQQLVGFLNWYSRFIPEYTVSVSPLLDLLSCPPPIRTSQIHENAYRQLKKAFFQDQSLIQPNYGVPFLVLIRVHDNCHTGCIFQRTEGGHDNIITMLGARFEYNISKKSADEKVLYALYHTLKRYKDLLLGYRIVLGKQVLNVLRKCKELTEVSGLCAKWLVYASAFNIDVQGFDDKRTISALGALEEFGVTPSCDHLDVIFELPNSESDKTGTREIEKACPDCRVRTSKADELLTEPSELLLCYFESIHAHQGTDPFCKRVQGQIERGEPTKFKILEGRLFKRTKHGINLLVIPEHVAGDLILFFHEVYCHPGVGKTEMLIKRQFYMKGLKHKVGNLVGRCVPCKHNKISNRSPTPGVARVDAKCPGDLLSVDIFGPLPLKRGGVVAVFVALDRLSGYVSYQPIRSMKADSFIRAMGHVLDEFDALDIPVKAALSDNARQFRSDAWVRFLHGRGIRPRFTATYNPSSNPVERAMRDLGEKLRLRINTSSVHSSDHSKWFRELKIIQKLLNSTPKVHGYSANQVLGIQDFDPLPVANIVIKAPNPITLAKDKITKLEENIVNYSVKTARRPSPLKFVYDHQGWAHLFTDGAAAGIAPESRLSAVAVWVAHDHRANEAKVTQPAMTNNQAEIFAIVRALEIACSHGVPRVVIHTDSAYVVDLLEQNLLSEENPKLSSYENSEWLGILRQAINLFEQGHVRIVHVYGHSVDFGNLEADYQVQRALKEYRAWMAVTTDARTERETIAQYVATFKDLEFEREYHHSLVSGKSFTQYREGDIVAIVNHELSKAYYGVTKKFYQKYKGEFLVIRRLGANAYILRDMECPEREIVANVRQLRLVERKLTSTSNKAEESKLR
jgi:ribonuclease HI